MADVARFVRVTGQVQGVFYRAWTQAQARELGISGWVRNCADGSVEAHVQGEDQAVDRMIERMRKGPANARVDDIDVEAAALEKGGRFELRR
jgi:acylphosphatase